MNDDEKKVESKLNKKDETGEIEVRQMSNLQPVKGYFKAGENSVVNLSCKTRKLARILEEKSRLDKNEKD